MNVAIILAAGESRRMGRPKQLLAFGDKTMLACVIEAFESPKIQQIIVVLGHKAEEISSRIGFPLRDGGTGLRACPNRSTQAGTPVPPEPFQIVYNPHYRHGMFTSVQAGLRTLPAKTKLLLIALCDQPRLQRTTVERLVETFERGKHKILIPSHAGRQGHPLLFSARYAPEILAMEDSLTLKHFLANHPDEIARLPVEDEGVLMDIDDPADYRKAVRSSR